MSIIETIRIHIFCKHPRKLEIKSDGDILDVAFYPTSTVYISRIKRMAGFENE